MIDYKMEAARAAMKLIEPNQTIGVGAGSTIANLVGLVAAECEFSHTLTFVSSSFKTSALIVASGLGLQSMAVIQKLDIYFDGCDQFDIGLNSLKSGGGIHTTEKILASAADQFILIGDEAKFSEKLDASYALVIEVIPAALNTVNLKLSEKFPDAAFSLRMSSEKDGAVISEYGNYLIDIHFRQLIDLADLNDIIIRVPGIVEHSLFYKMAHKALIAGKDGIRVLLPRYV